MWYQSFDMVHGKNREWVREIRMMGDPDEMGMDVINHIFDDFNRILIALESLQENITRGLLGNFGDAHSYIQFILISYLIIKE